MKRVACAYCLVRVDLDVYVTHLRFHHRCTWADLIDILRSLTYAGTYSKEA